MNNDLLRIVDAIHRDKNIEVETVFQSIEAAVLNAAKKYFGEDEIIDVRISRESGTITATHNGDPIDAETLGRISAQSAKQVMIQKIREAERDTLYDEYSQEQGTIVTGIVQRAEGGLVTVNIGKVEAILPRSEQIPGETYRPGERIKTLILDVRKSGQRVKIILSRAHADFVRRLFEQEIPEISDQIIEIRSIAREAGFRTKLAVSSMDTKVDCVGACVGVKGNRIKNVLDELGGERIDIIRYNESLQVMIPNALAPAQIQEVQIYPRIGRAIVLVNDDQLSLAIGKRGQNVRLASKLTSIDIEIMTFDELTEEIERAEENFSTVPGMAEEMIDSLIEEGLFSYADLSVMEPEFVMERLGVDEPTALDMIAYCEEMDEKAPAETGSRSSVLTGPASTNATKTAVENLLGPSEPVVEEKAPTVEDIFGKTEIVRPREEKITAANLFRDEKPDRDED